VNWIRLAQDRDRWRGVVSAVMNLRVLAPRSQLISLLFARINTAYFYRIKYALLAVYVPLNGCKINFLLYEKKGILFTKT
jgi:hypothetical protein